MTRHYSTILCAAVAALVALGLVMLASTSAWVSGMEDPYFFLSRQAAYAGVGLFAAIVVACLPLEWSRRCAPWAFGIVCVLLVLCYVPGVGVEIYGSKRWIRVPGIHQFQPSELAKIVVVICLASWFARWQSETRTFWRGFVLPGVIAGVPLLLIAGETDVGSALTLAITVAALLYCVGTRLIYMIPSAMAGAAAVLVYLYHNENRWDRILKWWDLENPEYALGTNMQQIRALYALGNGGAFGVGLGNGNEKFGTLTFAHIDFIFPVVGEELGLAFTLGTVLCYLLIAVAGVGIALQANHVFNRCLALGLTCLIVIPAMQNIAVTTAVLPNDGLPLPFVSYGGTSLVLSLMAVGLLVGIHRRSHVRVVEEYPLNAEARFAVKL